MIWEVVVIRCEEVDGVRKEKERLTTDHHLEALQIRRKYQTRGIKSAFTREEVVWARAQSSQISPVLG